ILEPHLIKVRSWAAAASLEPIELTASRTIEDHVVEIYIDCNP
ncbi:MAG: hypothetical protein QG666_1059, partial [Euryarchaeota archaeon]|nr:hypothetical protein [Euryarchaeota archaeon]